MAHIAVERRGSDGWEDLLRGDVAYAEPGTEWHSPLHEVALERVAGAAEQLQVDWRTAAQAVAVERIAEAARMRAI